jgi:hypothetical protein
MCLYVTCSCVTRAVLLNVHDQYINNFDTAKHEHTRLTREHTHLTRVHDYTCNTSDTSINILNFYRYNQNCHELTPGTWMVQLTGHRTYAFSASNRVLIDDRNRMGNKTFEMFVCLKDWLDVEVRDQSL